MADDKKLEVKSEAKPTGSFFAHPDPFVEIVWTILGLLILGYILNALFSGVLAIFSGEYLFISSQTSPICLAFLIQNGRKMKVTRKLAIIGIINNKLAILSHGR